MTTTNCQRESAFPALSFINTIWTRVGSRSQLQLERLPLERWSEEDLVKLQRGGWERGDSQSITIMVWESKELQSTMTRC